MTHIQIKKGHDINIAGKPRDEVIDLDPPQTVALIPIENRYCKPKLLVKDGDTVRRGDPLFLDKNMPDVKWASPGGGTIKKIQFGERRRIEQVIIDLDKDEDVMELDAFADTELSNLGREKVINHLLKANLWPLIRQRPFNKVAHTQDKPKAVFISGVNSAPMSPNLDLVLQGQESAFQAGLDVLGNLTEGKVHLTFSQGSKCAALSPAQNVELHTISGPHPAGNVGIQIHHIDPINPGDIIWTIDAQYVITLGKLFLTGKFDPTVVMTTGGPSVTNPVHLRTRIGVPVADLIEGRLDEGNHRIISGDVLTGKAVDMDEHVRWNHTTVSVIPVSHARPFLGWLRPGSSRSYYTVSGTYFGSTQNSFSFTTLRNGSERAMVPIGAWENVLPMDILPNPLYRSILADDIDEMEKLGILELDEEDVALCSFVCPSKIDLGAAIRRGLDIMREEG